MSAITALTLADGQSTPVNHIFSPYQPQNGSNPATWLEKSASSPTGYWRITMSVLRNGNGTFKTKILVAIPILASVSAGCCIDANTPVISFTELCNIEFSSPAGSTIGQRKDIRAIVRNFLASTTAQAGIEDLESAW